MFIVFQTEWVFLILLLNYFHILILAHEIIVDISDEDHMALNSIVLFYLRQCGAGGKEEIVF